MQWITTYWIVVSSAVIVSSVSDLSKQKRSLSFITNLLSNNVGRSQEKCTNTYRKPLTEYTIYEFPDLQQFEVQQVPQITRSKVPKRVNNNDNYLVTSLISGSLQAISRALGSTHTLLTRTSTKKSIKKMPQQLHYLSGQKLVVQHKPKVTMNSESFNVNHIVYSPPKTHTLSSTVQFVSPIIAMPRKYSYEQIKGNTVQKFTLDKNSDVIVTETKKNLPRPAYVDDRIKDIITSIPMHAQQVKSNIANGQYQERMMKSNVVFGQHQDFDMKMLPINDISMYSGKPIIVLDSTPNAITPTTSTENNEINTILEGHFKENTRGDIPD